MICLDECHSEYILNYESTKERMIMDHIIEEENKEEQVENQ